MRVRFRSWWQKTEKPVEVLGIIMALIAGIVLIYVVVHFNGTGFDGYNQTSISTDIAPSPHKITRTEVYQSGKTLWDWLQLLIIPLVLAVGGYVFNLTVSRNERDIAADNQREDAFQEYIDKMSALLLDRNLRDSAEDDEVRKIARVRTGTVLSRLDSLRKREVLQFLYESALLDKDKHIVDLKETDLSGANLIAVNLSGANLREAILVNANLRIVNLSNADLRRAMLFRTDLRKAHLSGTDLSNANLKAADLSGADLSNANLSSAVFWEADFSGAHLSGADLSNANLSSAEHVTVEQLEKAKSLHGTIMPGGFIHS